MKITAISNNRVFLVNLTLIHYGIGSHFLVRCDAVTVKAERMDSNGERQGTREMKMETNSQEEDGLKPQTDRDKGGRRREEIEQQKRLNVQRVFGVTRRSSENPESSIDSRILSLELLGGRVTHRGMKRLRERDYRARVESHKPQP